MKKNEDFLPLPGKLNILLAEDDTADILLFTEALDELPVTSTLSTVNDGDQLMTRLNKKRTKFPDVIFLDLNMPRKNGFAALGEIKRSLHLQHIPVIIFSTATEEIKIKQVYNDAAHFYIRKPTDFTELKKVIYKALQLISQKNLSLPAKDNFLLSS